MNPQAASCADTGGIHENDNFDHEQHLRFPVFTSERLDTNGSLGTAQRQCVAPEGLNLGPLTEEEFHGPCGVGRSRSRRLSR